MKKGPVLILVLSLLATSAFMFMRLNQIQEQNTEFLQKVNSINTEKEEDIELADVMTKMQWHSNKLWFAGKNQNWELAGFYVHEVEETLEELEEAKLVEDGVNYSTLAKSIAGPAVNKLEDVMESKSFDEFENAYTNLVNSCNNCHQASNHSFIVIKIPDTPVANNQSFVRKDSISD